jgi:hypothetical protein
MIGVDRRVNLGIISGVVFLLNTPFGYWRAKVMRFSFQWFLAVHLPVLLVIAFRTFCGIGWQMTTFLILVGAYFAGQLLGGSLSDRWKKT